MKGLKALVVAGFLVVGMGGEVQAAEELVIRTATTIAATDHLHDGKRLVVEGATLTVSGEHSYESVTLRSSAVLTSELEAAVSLSAGMVEVDATSRIDVSAKGKFGNTNVQYLAGGSYGGRGGSYSNYTTNSPYGDFREPVDLGTGGSAGGAFTRGGGALKLTATVLKLDGLIQSNGQAYSPSSYGSGSGGSLLLRVGTLTLGDQARIEASGGQAVYGGGGGGRVALYYDTVSQGSLLTQVWAKGGL
ncbi:hypothetical protein ACVW0Y_004672, partial [Pseudomonas sp. TE3786]